MEHILTRSPSGWQNDHHYPLSHTQNGAHGGSFFFFTLCTLSLSYLPLHSCLTQLWILTCRKTKKNHTSRQTEPQGSLIALVFTRNPLSARSAKRMSAIFHAAFSHPNTTRNRLIYSPIQVSSMYPPPYIRSRERTENLNRKKNFECDIRFFYSCALIAEGLYLSSLILAHRIASPIHPRIRAVDELYKQLHRIASYHHTTLPIT